MFFLYHSGTWYGPNCIWIQTQYHQLVSKIRGSIPGFFGQILGVTIIRRPLTSLKQVIILLLFFHCQHHINWLYCQSKSILTALNQLPWVQNIKILLSIQRFYTCVFWWLSCFYVCFTFTTKGLPSIRAKNYKKRKIIMSKENVKKFLIFYNKNQTWVTSL